MSIYRIKMFLFSLYFYLIYMNIEGYGVSYKNVEVFDEVSIKN